MATWIRLSLKRGINVDQILSWEDSFYDFAAADPHAPRVLLPCVIVKFAVASDRHNTGLVVYSHTYFGIEREALLAYFEAHTA